MKKRLKSIALHRIIPGIIVVIGFIIAAYPWISDYIYKNRVSTAISQYDNAVKDTDDAKLKQIKEDAVKYNKNLKDKIKTLHDPFADDAVKTMSKGYEKQLCVNGSTLMGYIEIPKIDVKLPIYHGTSQATLLAGIGHMEGTSLPVGGADTHCVLTGHTGLDTKKMFTDLDQLEIGDLFFINVLSETLCYKVEEINVVLPNETDSLLIREGEDLCTLITCTPYGINDHRLLVTGVRTEYKKSLKNQQKVSYQSQWKKEYFICIVIGLVAALMLFTAATLVKKVRHDKKK